MTEEGGELHLDSQRISFTITRSRRRRRTIAFVMETPSALRIMAPMRASPSSIRSALQKQTGWIKRRLREFQRIDVSPLLTPRRYEDGESVSYLGHSYRLTVTSDQNLPQGVSPLPHQLIVNCHPDNNGLAANAKFDPKASASEDMRLEILLWMKRRAKTKFLKRMDFWAKRLGVHYQKMVIANAGRRWGSCNSRNVIRLNWRLIMAPLPILDYVVVHELCHIRHKNHGAGFWGQVAGVIPDYKERRKQLRLSGAGFVL